eukprot:7236935-Karenia_brevis.AAC.1
MCKKVSLLSSTTNFCTCETMIIQFGFSEGSRVEEYRGSHVRNNEAQAKAKDNLVAHMPDGFSH